MSKNFIELINEYKIVIPLIQRDYAQGRESEKQKAVNFLNAIHDGVNNGLNLDFIYGKVDEDKFIPLDGQQRLTTLFLIYWYISLDNNYLPELSKFTYKVRSSTKDFIHALTQEKNWEKFKKNNIKELIEKSNWFFLSWKNDPTVIAILNMLDLIEERFYDIDVELLKNITFEVLYLDDFNLTDELYVKMNARGKPLTKFENFKAELEKYIDDAEIKARLDNKWMSIFWNIAKDKVIKIEDAPKLADKMFYNFFYNITFNFYLENIEKLQCNKKEFKIIDDFIKECSIFDFYKNVYNKKKNIDNLILILDNLIVDKVFLNFIEGIDIDQWERARFYAVSLGYTKNLELSEFKRWKRVSFNLINNQLIQSPDNLTSAIKSLKSLSDNCDKNIYDYIKSRPNNIEYFSKIQREEEALKTKLISENIDYEEELIKAESNWYLDGQVRFLLYFSNHNINNFIEYRDKFKALWDFAKNKSQQESLIYQALLSKGNYLPNLGRNNTFCSFKIGVRAKFDNWQKVFNSDKRKYLKDLLDDPDFEKDQIENSLNKIIGASQSNDWKSYFIKNSCYIEYCEKLQIRLDLDMKNIYLLKTTQMNGTHCELYSWDLFNNKFGLKQDKDREVWWRLESNTTFAPFKTSWYYESISLDLPCIVLDDFEYSDQILKLDIGHEKDGFFLSVYTEESELPDIILNKLKLIGFVENRKNTISYNDILREIQDTCNQLSQV